MRAAEKLIGCILRSSQIPLGRRREIQRELESHIEDFITAARDAGRGEDEIERLVLANFGDPGQIGSGFAWVYRHERRRIRALVFTLSAVLLSMALAAAILAMQTGLAIGFGTPITKVLASRHTVIEALDILASVAVYLGVTSLERVFKARQFPKAALLLTLIHAVLLASCAAAGLRANFLFFGLVNGLFFRAVQLFVASTAARAGIIVVCFPLTGLTWAVLRSPGSQIAVAATCASWLAMGLGYQLMTHFAARLDAALLNGLQRSS